MTVYKPEVQRFMQHNTEIWINPVEGIVTFGHDPTSDLYVDAGQAASAKLIGFLDGQDRPFWAQLLTSGVMSGAGKGGNDAKLWSVCTPTLDTRWQSKEWEAYIKFHKWDYMLWEDWLKDSPDLRQLVPDLTATSTDEYFRSWYMYEPEPGDDGPRTIPVPIMTIEWGWGAKENKDPATGRWELSYKYSLPACDVTYPTLEYPKWNQVIRGILPKGTPPAKLVVPMTVGPEQR